jgi:MurNAc alpha-1-phosphate uridylyltransferase
MMAMILAAGLGARMGALTRDVPKPLLTVDGQPLIVHRVRALVAAGFTDLVVNVAYLGEQIEAALGDGSGRGARIAYSREPDGPLGTGGGIKRALPLLGPQPFVLVNADVRCDYPLAALRRAMSGLGHLVLVDNPDHNAAGDFALRPDGRVANAGQPMLTFSGVSVIDPRLLDGVKDDNFSLTPLLRRAAGAGQITGERHAGEWLDVGTPDRLALAQGGA